MGYGSRKPDGNEPAVINDNLWLEQNDIEDEVSLLLSGKARRCVICRKAARLKHLDDDGRCPDCR